ncbi:biopolymer transporter ExbD [Thalassotalea litorea]|uniref:Biopolymer transporter ExbD n=1 Tax=Thalassotalea litorea TaxID=2020715 RepID=A0A5R9ISA6_9GAMM|nr:biopolymer transporter ExbD [Thalassotalea litorea]TLU64798.1 biopolymer transporter ExbD [Thalassotalea litorea]
MGIKRARENDEAEVDMTPMLDIVFIMLIFFIVTTSFVKESGLDVNRPKATKSQNDSKQKSILVRVNEYGNIIINNRIVDEQRVEAYIESLLAENPTDTIVLDAHEDVTHETIVTVADQVKALGLNIAVVSKI